MKRLAIAGAIVFLAIVAYRFQYPNATVRYRLTLEAEVEGKHEIGSGVIEVSYSKNSHFFGSNVRIRERCPR